jgi:hypothetical protein
MNRLPGVHFYPWDRARPGTTTQGVLRRYSVPDAAQYFFGGSIFVVLFGDLALHACGNAASIQSTPTLPALTANRFAGYTGHSI